MTRTPAENKFRRDFIGTPARPAKVELKKLYDDAADKTQFKLDWVTNEYEATRTIRGENTAWGEVDVTLGEYMSYGSVVKDLGGWEWPPAVAGAKRICAKCVKFGGKWTVKEDFRSCFSS
jgi:hypothetical protein